MCAVIAHHRRMYYIVFPVSINYCQYRSRGSKKTTDARSEQPPVRDRRAHLRRDPRREEVQQFGQGTAHGTWHSLLGVCHYRGKDEWRGHALRHDAYER